LLRVGEKDIFGRGGSWTFSNNVLGVQQRKKATTRCSGGAISIVPAVAAGGEAASRVLDGTCQRGKLNTRSAVKNASASTGSGAKKRNGRERNEIQQTAESD